MLSNTEKIFEMSIIAPKTDKQKGAEAKVDSFRKDLGPFVVAAETTRMAMVFTDAKAHGNPLIFANDSFLLLTGYDRDEALGQHFNFLVGPGADAATLAQLEDEFEGRCQSGTENAYCRKDGSAFCAATFISPVLDEAGAVVMHFVSFADMTKHRDYQTRSKMLIDELNHRVKNTLSTVQSIVWQALRNADPLTLRDTIESRLLALSRSHDLLTLEHWESAKLADVVNTAMEPFASVNGRSERFSIRGSSIRIPPKATLALGIAFHELATNAVKYGAFSNETGSISISWAVEPSRSGKRLVLHWREKDGPPVSPPSRKGFGSQVIERGLAHELDGSAHLEFRPDGLACMISIPEPQVDIHE